MSTTQQPEALRLEVSSSAMADEGEMIHLLPWHEIRNLLRADATELRRLHSENEALQAGYPAARLEIESLQARIKTVAEERSDSTIKRYKIGYPTDEWGVRSSTPGGIADPSGQWVLYKDHLAALASHGPHRHKGALL